MAVVIFNPNTADRISTSWQSYTATYSSLTNATASTFWKRDGQHLLIEGKVSWTGAGGAGNFTVDLPGAEAGTPLIDTAALPGGTGTSNQAASLLGDGYWFDSGTGWAYIYARYVDTNTVGFVRNPQVVDGGDFANGDSFNFSLKLPIVGWT